MKPRYEDIDGEIYDHITRRKIHDVVKELNATWNQTRRFEKYLKEKEANVNELEEASMNMETKALEMIDHYITESNKHDGIVIGNAPRERANGIIEFLQVIGKDDLVKHVILTGETEVEEE